ncbi:ribbon-helix-helix protein, CopG family [Rhizobium sp. Leaf383]|uniref:ribbon-helix-helix protein, CopG family n=1 Tax=Rhizobium sp. Leaf383 TaxID=1736357 RepID=UPI0009EBCE3A|nr:ribbon-helix-helix protein, CopG family [Rhizobium sp. Leaf383]
MSEQVLMNVKVDRELKEAFTARVAEQDRNVSQVLRELMRAYVRKPTTELKLIEETKN